MVRSSAVRSGADVAQRSGPPRVPLWVPIVTGIGAATTIGVTAVAGCVPAEDRTPSLPATAGKQGAATFIPVLRSSFGRCAGQSFSLSGDHHASPCLYRHGNGRMIDGKSIMQRS